MRFGLIVDGQAEFRSLPALMGRVDTPHVLIKTLYADMQPLGPVPQIINAMRSRILILAREGADMVIALLDRESRDVCPGHWAEEIISVVADHCRTLGISKFGVVIKNSCYENWLVADTTVFGKMRRIAPNKADSVDAQAILGSAAQKEAYSKVEDAKRIMSLADPMHMAANSRSFRRLLRLVDNPHYLTQSKKPHSRKK
jgi:Domain of unknown function (DUF4276)